MGYEILSGDPKALKSYGMNGMSRSVLSCEYNRPQLLNMASSIAKLHHERWDGKGYPEGLAQEAIPMEARIVALADVYDALRSDRPYKPAFSEEKAVSIIQKESGFHFDPDVVQAFTKRFDDIRWIGTQIEKTEAVGPAEV